ncbi:MAG: excinuclease ABC subunit UvrC [Aeriscardovia sp.]|nr:excinuclease ABC subunit UvrC [Aeriscardovia sp.]
MLDPDSAPQRRDIPDTFGVYKWKDAEGKVIYVGKAKSLRNRLSFYFQPLSSLPPRTRSMVSAAKSLEWTVVDNELEALALEYSWIKEFDPKFNVVFKDDKSYPYLALSSGQFPRLFISRRTRRRGLLLFGPFANLKLSRLLGPLTQIFPLRTCSDESFKRHRAHARACIFYELGRCSGPCVGAVGEGEYAQIAKAFSSALSSPSKAEEVKAGLKREMEKAKGEFNFEKAARVRDELLALEEVTEKNSVLRASGDEDVFAASEGEGICYFYQMSVRGGRIRAERSWSADFVEGEKREGLLSRLLFSFYSSLPQSEFEKERSSVPGEGFMATRPSWPKEVLVPFLPAGAEGIGQMLSSLAGRKVEVRVPRRGPRRALLQEAQKNAEEGLKRLEKSSLKKSASRRSALEELQKALALPSLPLLIEGFDISNSASGGQQAGSCVSFENGQKNGEGYRKFSLPVYKDDLSALEEVVERRYEMDLPLPDLIVVDGGPEQLKSARRGLEKALGEAKGGKVPLCSLSKRLEEVWREGDPYPLVLSRTDPALLLLEEVRDESHRFAISYHRSLRRRSLSEE